MHYSVCDMVLDLLQNSITAGARQIGLQIWREGNFLGLGMQDDGCGMTGAELTQAVESFYTRGAQHLGRRFGLGLPFAVQAAQLGGGSFQIRSREGRGTEWQCRLDQSHIDAQPEGDWVAMLVLAMCFEGGYELCVEQANYRLRRSELRHILGDFSRVGNILLLREFIRSQEGE